MINNCPPCFDWHSVKKTLELVFSGLTALGTIAVAVVAIWGDWIRAHFAPGKLVVETYEDSVDLINQPPNQIYYYHLRVVNRRHWRRPENCRVLLKAMSRRGPNGIFQPIQMPVPLQFIWSPENIEPSAITIPDRHSLDFGCVRQGNVRFEPRLYWTPNNFTGFVGAHEAIRYSLQIVSDAYTSKTYQVFEVAFDGVWDAVPAQMQTHLTIQEITA
jgi:hypothetical protein